MLLHSFDIEQLHVCLSSVVLHGNASLCYFVVMVHVCTIYMYFNSWCANNMLPTMPVFSYWHCGRCHIHTRIIYWHTSAFYSPTQNIVHGYSTIFIDGRHLPYDSSRCLLQLCTARCSEGENIVMKPFPLIFPSLTEEILMSHMYILNKKQQVICSVSNGVCSSLHTVSVFSSFMLGKKLPGGVWE